MVTFLEVKQLLVFLELYTLKDFKMKLIRIIKLNWLIQLIMVIHLFYIKAIIQGKKEANNHMKMELMITILLIILYLNQWI